MNPDGLRRVESEADTRAAVSLAQEYDAWAVDVAKTETESMRRRRAGLQRLLEEARELGFRVVRLESAAFMTEAHRLYRSFGFESVAPYEGREFAAVEGAEEIRVFMALTLGDYAS